MRILLTAGTLVLALTLTGPARAQAFDTQGVTEALIAAIAAYLIGDAIGDAREDRAARDDRREAELLTPPAPPVVQAPARPAGALLPPRELGGLPVRTAPPVTHAPQPPRAIGATPPVVGGGSRWVGTTLPPACRISRGIFDARCLVDSLPVSAPLPAACRDRRVVQGHIRSVFRASCLRDAGYNTIP